MVSITWKLWILAVVASALVSSMSISGQDVSSADDTILHQHIQLLAKMATDLDNEVMNNYLNKRGHQGFGKRAGSMSADGKLHDDWLLNYLKNRY